MHESDKLLKSYVDQDKVPSALLFVGESADELVLRAKTFAIDVMERLGADSDQIQKASKDLHPDVRHFYPSSQMGVYTIEQIRDITSESQLFPHEGPCQFFILALAERMHEAAANALLKTLEEPSSKTTFILLAKSADLLLPTITSRVQKVQFETEVLGSDLEELLALESFLSTWPSFTYNALYQMCEKVQGGKEKEKDLTAKLETQKKSQHLLCAVEKWYQSLEGKKPSTKRFEAALEKAKIGIERSVKLSHVLEYLLISFINYD